MPVSTVISQAAYYKLISEMGNRLTCVLAFRLSSLQQVKTGKH